MALTVRGLIEKLEQVEDKSGDVLIEMPDDFISVGFVFFRQRGRCYSIKRNQFTSLFM